MTSAETLAEFLPPYIAEVEELLTAARSNLVASDAAAREGRPHPKAVRELFRNLHTIKGLSAMVSVEPIVAVSHLMEAALRMADAAAGRLEPAAFDVLHAGLTAIEQRLEAVIAGREVPPAPSPLIDALEALTGQGTALGGARLEAKLPLEPRLMAKLSPSDQEQLLQAVAGGRRAVRVDFTPSPERASRGININSARQQLGALGELIKVLPMTAPVSAAAPGGLFFTLLMVTEAPEEELAVAAAKLEASVQLLLQAGGPRPAAPAPAGQGELEPEEEPTRNGVVRVESARLDEAMDRVGALIVGRSRLLRAEETLRLRGVDTRELQQLLSENGRLLRDMRASILRIRMVRVTEVLERLPLMVRGLRRTTGKQVALVIDAGNAELDKSVGDRLFPAIVHLVRNAVDHALESPQERRTLGKPPEGVLRIEVKERSNSQLELTLRDDGRGVDAARVASAACAPVPQSEEGLLGLLCRPGLSTCQDVTTTSGRGMGMDIVKRIVVDQLGGALRMATVPGQGTTFTLRVPLTISIVEAFIFECGAQRYAAPVSSVAELVELDPSRLIAPPAPDAPHPLGMIERRGGAVPVIDLRELLGGRRQEAAHSAIVIHQQAQRLAFAVDRLVAQQEIVLRPLVDPLVRLPGISGATDLGDGKPILVLDLAALGTTFKTAVAGRPS